MSLASSLLDESQSESSFLTGCKSALWNATQYHRTGGLEPASRYSQAVAVETHRPQSPPSPPLHAQRSSAETTNDDIHNTHNRLRRRFAAILDDLDQSSLLLPLPFDDVGSEENGGQDADELD